MAHYYVREYNISDKGSKNAVGKARDDLYAIFASMRMLPVSLPANPNRKYGNNLSKLADHFRSYHKWSSCISELSSGDILLVQFPSFNHTLLFGRVIKRLKSRGVKCVLATHDIEMLRKANRADSDIFQKTRINLEELRALQMADAVIVHNERMRDKLVELANCEYGKMVPLVLFDYLLDNKEADNNRFSLDKPIVIAGNLAIEKAKYAYCLPSGSEFNLYGADYTAPQRSGVNYFGAYDPDELPYVIDGSFGLVWDGESCDTCAGTYGNYLRINNPHKMSLYLAAGMPVIVWDEAAVADFVLSHNCGIAVSSISDIPSACSQVSPEHYAEMLHNAKEISVKLTNGKFTEAAIEKVLTIIEAC